MYHLSCHLARTFNVHPGEERPVTLLLGYAMMLGAGRVLSIAVVSGLFLNAFSAQMLAYVYIGLAFSVPITGWAFGKLRTRLTFAQITSATTGLVSLSLGVFWLGLHLTNADWVVMALAMWVPASYVLMTLAFQAVSSQLFNLRQHKRLSGLIHSGDTVALIIGGLLTPPLVLGMGAVNLLLVAAAILLAAFLPLRMIALYHSNRSVAANTREMPQPQQLTDNLALFRNRDVWLIFGLVTFSFMSYFYIDNMFFALASAHFFGVAAIANLVGISYAMSGLLTILFQCTLVRPFFAHYSALVNLLTLPTTMLFGIAAVTIAGTALGAVLLVFGLMLIVRIWEHTLRFSLDQMALQTIYQPFPPSQRSILQPAVEGGVKPLAAGLAGVSMLIANSLLGVSGIDLGYALLGLLALWLFFACAVGWAYPLMMRRLLGPERTDLVKHTLSTASVETLRQYVQIPQADAALFALKMLEEKHRDALPEVLPGLFFHPAIEVRQAALQQIEHLNLLGMLPMVQQCIERDSEPVVRGAALRVLAALRENAAADQLEPYLEHPNLHLCSGAMVGLLRHGGIAGLLTVGPRLHKQMRSGEPFERALAALVMGDAGLTCLYRPLADLLHDSDRAVRWVALSAAGKIDHPRLWPLVVDSLADQSVQANATAVLAASGPSALPALQEAFARASDQSAMRARLACIGGQIGGAQVIDWLQQYLDDPDEIVRHQVLLALQRCGYRATGAMQTRVQAQINAEVAHATWVMAVLRDLGTHPSTNMLHHALRNSLVRGRERIFILLSSFVDPHALWRAREYLEHPADEQQLYATEVLDMFLPRQLRSILPALLDDSSTADQQTQLPNIAPQRTSRQRIKEIANGRNTGLHPWMKACAMYLLRCGNMQYGSEQSEEYMRAINLVERVMMLKATSVFNTLPDEVLADIAANLQESVVPSGQPIVMEGDIGRDLYIIARGQVQLSSGGRVLAELGEHGIFGDLATLIATPQPASVIALSDTSLLQLSQNQLTALMEEHTTLAHAIMRTLAHHLRECLQELNQLGLQRNISAIDAPVAMSNLR